MRATRTAVGAATVASGLTTMPAVPVLADALARTEPDAGRTPRPDRDVRAVIYALLGFLTTHPQTLLHGDAVADAHGLDAPERHGRTESATTLDV